MMFLRRDTFGLAWKSWEVEGLGRVLGGAWRDLDGLVKLEKSIPTVEGLEKLDQTCRNHNSQQLIRFGPSEIL